MNRAPPVPPPSSPLAPVRLAPGAAVAVRGPERRGAEPFAAEAEVRAALELMPQLVWTTTPDGYHDYYNARWYAYTGMPRPGDPRAHAEGWNWKTYLHPDDYERTVAVWTECLATGAPYEIEYRFKEAASGAYRWFLGRALPLRETGVDGQLGRIVRWFGTCTDIDDQRHDAQQRRTQATALEVQNRQLQEQQAALEAQTQALHVTAARLAERTAAAEAARADAEAARRTAEMANRAKGEFLAVMSHELRTPLNAIGGYAELIELGIRGPVTAEQRTDLARIQASQRHLLGLIAGVLDYSRVEAGVVTYQLAAVPVTDAVAEAESLVEPQLRAKGLGYRWSGAPPGLAVRADREKLQQILLNLLGNAVKFTGSRDGAPGRVEVWCSVEERAADGTEGARVALRLRDTGEGIAAEQLERIFEPFVQADQRLTRPHAGVGLGLAISRDLARGMGGNLTVESTPGVGSTFTLTLPAA